MSLPNQGLWQAIIEEPSEHFIARLADEQLFATQAVASADQFLPEIIHWIYKGDSPLHVAAAGYRVEIAAALLAAGADVTAARNRRKAQPMHYAADGHLDSPNWNPERQMEMLRVLLDAGASLHCQDLNGATPLHRAVRTRCSRAVRFLLSSGADPTLRNHSGSTAFHLAVQSTGRGGSGSDAARKAQEEIVGAFVAHGVDVELRDGNGTTVWEAATRQGVRSLLR